MINETVTDVNLGIKLIQNSAGLNYGTDAYLLAAYLPVMKNAEAVEIGGGSGIISLLAAQREKFSHITCVEVQDYYAELCKRNIELNGMEKKIASLCCDIRDCTIRNVPVVFGNPPFMKNNAGKRNEDDGKNSARHELHGDISELCRAASAILKYGGYFFCVYRPDRLTDLTDGMRKSGIEPKKMTFVHADVAHAPCLVLVTGKKGGKSGVEITRPLILTDRETGRPTEDSDFIYSECEWIK